MVCSNCHKEIDENVNFCNHCGTPVEKTVTCPNCGAVSGAEFSFCQSCGTRLSGEESDEGLAAEVPMEEPVPEPSASAAVAAAPAVKKTGGFSLKKGLLFGGIGVGVLALFLVFILAVMPMFKKVIGDREDPYQLYIKDWEIYYRDLNEESAQQVTTRFVNGLEATEEDAAEAAYWVSEYLALSEDGNRLFFPDKVDDAAEDGPTIYYRDLNKPEQEPVKIDSEIVSYAISPKGDQVLYVKGEDWVLYLHDLTDKERIATGVYGFMVSEDFTQVGYMTEDGSIYHWVIGEEPEKIASNVDELEYVAEDFSVFYYTKDGDLYKQVMDGSEKVKFAGNVSDVQAIYDSGELYFSRTVTVERPLSDYVNDDAAAADAAMVQPEYPVYPDAPVRPRSWYYDTSEEYQAALFQYNAEYAAYEAERDQLYNEYQTAMAAYYAKLERDSVRQTLTTTTKTSTEYSLYYYNGSEEILLTDKQAGSYGERFAGERPVAVYWGYRQAEIPKVNLSEIQSASEVSDKIDMALYSARDCYISIGGTPFMLEEADIDRYVLSDNGDTLYFLDNVSDNDVGDVYKLSIQENQLGTPGLYDTEVSAYGFYFYGGKDLVYYKNVDTEYYKGDLYFNGEEIDYDVRMYMLYDVDGVLYYFTDWNSNQECGVLKMYADGIRTKISDDVYDYEVLPNGEVVYLYDYSTTYYKGTLRRYNGGEPEKLADDVAMLLYISEYMVKGDSWDSYYWN